SVDLAYSTDGGATYPNVIATGIANSGTYVWTVPNTPTTAARVQVTAHDAACSSASDASDADFTIFDLSTATLLATFVANPRAEGIELRWQVAADWLTAISLERSET